MTSTTGQEQQGSLELKKTGTATGPVECLGLTFENDQARRDHFLGLLKEKLDNPEFRKIPGFPKGSDEAILSMSDPPYYTACPNPFLEDFIRCYGKPYDSKEPYQREPFAVDVSVGKTDQLYKAHGYHTKVPHLAIVPSILHYTKPGDVVLDGFCGSGMTGLAAQWCGTASLAYRQQLEALWKSEGHAPPEWGVRKVVLNDLGPAASFIAAGYNLPFDVQQFEQHAQRILGEVEEELGWMYEALHVEGSVKGRINYLVWSEVFACPECAGEVGFVEEALDVKTKKTRDRFPCPHCGADLNKDSLERIFQTRIDPVTGQAWKRISLRPALINYSVGKKTYERPVGDGDLEILDRIERMPYPADMPCSIFPISEMYHGSRIAPKGFTSTHHFYFTRTAHALAALWRKVCSVDDGPLSRALKFWLDSQLVNLSIENRYRPGVSFPYNPLSGVYYIASMISEADYHKAYRNKLARILGGFSAATKPGKVETLISTADCAGMSLPPNSIDYIFTDPPFGANIFYSDLNFLVESWHGVVTSTETEAIVDGFKKKGVREYQNLMWRCFSEYQKALKPGHWMTVVFSNSSNGIWRAIQEAIGAAGFVVADVRTLDKQQGSYRQVTSSAVKQDLVISAYKPTDALQQRFEIGHSSIDAAWAFVREHLHNVPVFVGRSNEVELVAERTPQMLLDRMIAFHVQHGISVPLSGPEFLQGLVQRFPQRDGMYFLPDQVTEYDRKRTSASELRQLNFFVNDEHSAIQWIRQQLQDKPQSFQDLQPQFMRELQAWAKHEQTVELKLILEQNFLHYEGHGPVPSQIHSYLSSNFKDLRNLSKEDPKLIEKAQDRWYVPDPNKQADVDHRRDRALLKEFEEVKESSQRKIKVFRTEAIRAGFKACWQERDYATIVKVAAKLPDAVLQEDEKLLMYVDNAQTRLGDEE